jgi:hypothetical protein
MANTGFFNEDLRNFMTRGLVKTRGDLDPFTFAQDPTFLSFKVEFFPVDIVPRPGTVGESGLDKMLADPFLVHNLSHDGLLKPAKFDIDSGFTIPTGSAIVQPKEFKAMRNPAEYSFSDSAEDYLYSIGSVNRIGYLRAFKELLYKLETQAPWFFQKITGTSSLYTLDTNVNTKRDGVLTFECLETVDMRMSMLADFYRQVAFDFERHREVLPYNLRTFRMKIHVFEMRNFNTSSGTLASLIAGSNPREYEEVIKSRAAHFGDTIQSALAGAPPAADFNRQQQILASQFDAISMQTYELGLCEFDFYSQAPSYMEELTVVDVPQATSAFKIKFGTVKKTGKYSFYKYLTDYVIKSSLFPSGSGPFSTVDVRSPLAAPFYDAEVTRIDLQRYGSDGSTDLETRTNKIAGIGKTPLSKLDQDKALERILLSNQNQYGNRVHVPHPSGIGGLILGAAESAIGTAISKVQSKIQHALLGNAFDNIPSPAEASQALLGFFNPNLGLGGRSAGSQSTADPGNVNFEPMTVDKHIDASQFEPLAVDHNITGGGFDNLSSLSPITPDNLVPLPVNQNITLDSLVPLPLYSTLSPGGFDALTVDPNITADTFDTLNVDNTVSGGGFDSLPPYSPISSGGYDALTVHKDIVPVNFVDTPVNSDIKTSPLDSFVPNTTLDQSPLEAGPKPPEINPKNENFEKNEQTKTLKNKSVGFDRPPEQPQISPKNIFTRNI